VAKSAIGGLEAAHFQDLDRRYKAGQIDGLAPAGRWITNDIK
jgi:hypothetical protein